MPDTNEWLFDIIWDLSDRAQEANLPELAKKLEEAMDTYLAETTNSQPPSVGFQSQRYAETNERINGIARENVRAAKALNAILADFRARPGQKPQNPVQERPQGVNMSLDQPNARFAWPV